MQFQNIFQKIVVVSSIFLLFSGCAGILEKKETTPEALLKEAIIFLKVKNYQDAKTALTQLLEDFPDSKERATAELLRAEVFYRDKEHEQAKFYYQRFIEQYPTHPKVDRGYYFKAMSDYRLMEIASRDQTSTHNALEGFENLIRLFPNSKYHDKALERKKECLEVLATNQMEIGRFYFRTSSFHSAIIRLKSMLETYPDLKFTDEVLFMLGESYYNEQNFKSARTYFYRLLKKFPQSEYVKEARIRLKEIR